MLSEEQAIENLKDFKSINVLYGNTFVMFLEQLKKYQESIEIVLNLITRLEKENESLNKMETTYKLALFMIIRNSTVMPKGIKLGKNDKEINERSYETLCEVLAMLDYNIAKKLYNEGEITFENNIGKESENE